MEWKEPIEHIIHIKLSEIIKLYDDQEIMTYLKGITNQTEIRTVRSMLRKRIVTIFKRILKVQLTLKRKMQNVFKNGSDSSVSDIGLNWRDIIVCPYCKNKLTEINRSLECRTCNKKYPILEGDIPSFVDEVDSEC
ncbi:unnamed protein product [marine sediment metagenome]|uniref:Uncharacterized protein n=1 Tax=marine sediment metagenome TaxID=412755 RepID=X1T144_9ZZZZ